jgi:HlyD family secretion protein
LDLQHRLKLSDRTFHQYQDLFDKKLISQNEFEAARDGHENLRKRLDLTVETWRQDSIFRTLQVEMLEASVERIQANLEVVRKNLDNLHVRAPVSGQLTSLNAEVGESKSRGERLGQIDVLDGSLIRAAVDEHYISRLDLGLHGSFTLSGQTYDLTVTKIYPAVHNGRFEIDLEFAGEAPVDIKRGQSVHVRLELGDLSESILLPRGPFYQKTGGRWVYVLDESGDFATKREIRIGQQNPNAFEVLEGLSEGERVVTSSYANFGDAEKLILK